MLALRLQICRRSTCISPIASDGNDTIILGSEKLYGVKRPRSMLRGLVDRSVASRGAAAEATSRVHAHAMLGHGPAYILCLMPDLYRGTICLSRIVLYLQRPGRLAGRQISAMSCSAQQIMSQPPHKPLNTFLNNLPITVFSMMTEMAIKHKSVNLGQVYQEYGKCDVVTSSKALPKAQQELVTIRLV